MEVDWLSLLLSQGETFMRKSRLVARLSQRHGLTLHAASQLYLNIEASATRYDEVFDELTVALGTDDPLVTSAADLKQLWILLCVAVANIVRELQGLPPLEPFKGDAKIDD